MNIVKNFLNVSISSSSKTFLDIEDHSKGEKIGEVVLSSRDALSNNDKLSIIDGNFDDELFQNNFAYFQKIICFEILFQ